MALLPTITSAQDLLPLAALALLAYLLLTTLHTLYLHPLAHYPGPLLARLSTFPSWYATTQQDRHLWLARLHATYGPAVRYRPDSVAFNTPSAFRAVIGDPRANVTKSIDYDFWPRHAGVVSTLQTRDNAVHGRRRRVLANAFSERALRGYEPFVKANLERWVELLGEQLPPDGKGDESGDGWSRSVNAADWFNWLVFDIMGDLCFGKPFGVKEPGSALRQVIHDLGDSFATMYPLSVAPWTPLWIWLKPRGLDRLLDHVMPAYVIAWWGWLAAAQAERTTLEETQRASAGDDKTVMRRDFFHYLFDVRDAETGALGYTKDELWEETQLLVAAGADTTAIVLAAVLFYLVRDEGVQARLAREVLGVFGGASEIVPGAKLQSCKYLRAVILEGLRMAPPVGADLRREVLPGGTVIEGQFFPAGVVLSACTYALGYNEEVFAAPFRFDPGRWLVSDKTGVTQLDVEQRERALAAFSAGTRGCVGKNLAWVEMMLVLAKLVYVFEIRRDPADNLGGGRVDGRLGRRNPEQYQVYDIFVALRDGPMVQLKKRVHS